MSDVEMAECDDCGTGVTFALAWDRAVPVVVLSCNCRMVEAVGFEVESLADRWK